MDVCVPVLCPWCLAMLQNQGFSHVTAEGSSLQLKVAWYGAELFGKVMGGESKQQAPATPLQNITWDQALQEIRADFDNNYFVSGDAEMIAYDPQVCPLNFPN